LPRQRDDALLLVQFVVQRERIVGRMTDRGGALAAETAEFAVQRHLNFGRGLQIETRIVKGEDVAETVVGFAREQKVTQIFIARLPETTVLSLFKEGLVQRIVNLAHDMQVTVVADRSVRRGA
jgi:K+-sensing histidine kinase KdpD